ncbi:hypothetical protein GH714_033941 [Hevea brasiliensis]|uniref:Major facilitator superfamily (MFS) profile domain-containing protein n=1 Tax=Hevea brasiliensis TaxID=3981 RepID=A0A6A6LLG6_HEVBR|nr:hypothetical protein GH714_033941 [Hevea brasiliensis]
MIAPVYSAEVSSPSSRGFLTSLPELGISIGILLGYISNVIFGKLTLKLGWRLMLGVAAIPSVILAFGIVQMPESPRWLVMQGRLGEAKKILLLISNSKEEAEARFRDIKVAVGIDENCNEDFVNLPKKTHGEGAWKELLLRPTPAVRVGRRRLLLTSTAGIVASLTVLASCLTIVEYHTGRKLLWALSLSIIATYVFVAFFNIGLAPVTWVYSSEIFPLKLRAQGYSIGVAVNRLMNATISMSFISLYKAITIGGAFFMFAGVSVIAWFFFYFLFPETKGRSLEELELLFSNGIMARNETMELQPRARSNNV